MYAELSVKAVCTLTHVHTTYYLKHRATGTVHYTTHYRPTNDGAVVIAMSSRLMLYYVHVYVHVRHAVGMKLSSKLLPLYFTCYVLV